MAIPTYSLASLSLDELLKSEAFLSQVIFAQRAWSSWMTKPGTDTSYRWNRSTSDACTPSATEKPTLDPSTVVTYAQITWNGR